MESPYSYIRHLCWGLFLNHDPQRTWIAVMTEYAFYMDTSGHPDDQPYIVVAGFLATEQQWFEFEPEWKAALQKHNLGTVFHMVDFESSKPKNRGAVLEHLTGIINSHTTAHFSCFIPMADYKKVNEIYAIEEYLGTPYAVAARGALVHVNSWKKRHFKPGDHLISFVERGTKHQGDMDEVFRRDEIGLPIPVEKSHPCVQPGDLLGWEIFTFLKTGIERKSLVNLLNERDFDEGIMAEQNLIRSCKNAKVPLRKDLSPNLKVVYHSSPKRPRRRTIR
jgi:hypothetical protein